MAGHVLYVLVVTVAVCSSVTSSSRRPPSKYKYPWHMPKVLHLDQCEVVVRSDCLKKPLPRGKRICVQMTDDDLLKKLKDIGGFNPKYVAMNRKDAAKFKDPRLFYPKQETRKKLPTRAPDCNHKPTLAPPTRRPTRRPFVTRPPWRPTRRPWGTRPPWRKRPPSRKRPRRPRPRFIQSSNREDVLRISKRTANDSKDCWETGSAVVGSSSPQRHHLCGECRLTRHLDDDRIPRFINEAVCKHLFDEQSSDELEESNECAWKSGLCQQRSLSFPAIRLTGEYELKRVEGGRQLYVERLEEIDLQIRSGCQCEVYNNRAIMLKRLLAIG